jgi:hypothetical protein
MSAKAICGGRADKICRVAPLVSPDPNPVLVIMILRGTEYPNGVNTATERLTDDDPTDPLPLLSPLLICPNPALALPALDLPLQGQNSLRLFRRILVAARRVRSPPRNLPLPPNTKRMMRRKRSGCMTPFLASLIARDMMPLPLMRLNL